MSSYEYKRIYHPKLGRFVYEHKGSGLLVDNIFEPVKKVLSKASEMVLKPFAKRAMKSGIEHAGDKLGKKAAEKSGEMIMKRLHGTKPSLTTMKTAKPKPKQEEEDHDIILNRLINGNGFLKR